MFIDWVTFFQIKDRKRFIEWLRTKMINCWDTKIRKFDKDLIKSTHLIRAELSKNKKGYKTFLGYTHNDLSFIPYVCNEDNRIYPRIGKIKLSSPHCAWKLIEDYLEEKNKPRPTAIISYDRNKYRNEIRDCVEYILSEDFKKLNDGLSRGLFILVNELKKVYDKEKVKSICNDWNQRMGNKLKSSDIDYRINSKMYSLPCKYIHSFLKELGNQKVFKCC